MKTYKFNQLSLSAQFYAIQEYLAGWLETHKDDSEILHIQDIWEILQENDDNNYSVIGAYVGEQE